MPRKRGVEIDDLVKLHVDPIQSSNSKSYKKTVDPIQSSNSKSHKKTIDPIRSSKSNSPKKTIDTIQSSKSKSRKKSKPVITPKKKIKLNSQVNKVQLKNIVPNETSPYSSKLNSPNKITVEALMKDISLPHSEDLPLNVFDSFEEDTDEIIETDMLKQLIVLNTLNRKETELRTTILYEKLKQEEKFITKGSLLKEKISKLETEVQNRKMDLRLKETMCSEIQLMETIRQISLPHRRMEGVVVQEVYDFSDAERGVILGHLLKKEQLKRELSSEQQEIAKMEENCWKMNLSIEGCGDKSTSEKLDKSIMNSDDWKEIECLKTENQKRSDRIQLFAKLVQFLIKSIEKEHNLNDDLKQLASTCEQIQHWNYDDVDELEELCKEVHSTKL